VPNGQRERASRNRMAMIMTDRTAHYPGRAPQNSERRLRVAVVDDHPIFRAGVIESLIQSGHFDVVGEGANSADAVRLAGEASPDIILLDVRMPGDGIEATVDISQRWPGVKIVMLTAFDDEALVTRSLSAGASGYVLKGVSAGELKDSLRAVAEGGGYVSPSLAARLLAKRGKPSPDASNVTLFLALTPREDRILRGVTLGLSNREIGEQLGLSEKSIKHHMTNILQKLQARNRVEAAMMARTCYGTNPPGPAKGR
jgi:two-component system nitrate/nitrite response regulator NarL